MIDVSQSYTYQLETGSLISNTSTSHKVTSRSGACSLILIGLREKNNPLKFASFIWIKNIQIKRKDGTQIKNKDFDAGILRCLNTYEHDTGEFFLKKNLIAFSFDSMIDRIILMGYHGAVEVLEDEFYIEFQVGNKSELDPTKSYEIIVMMYRPKLLEIDGNKKDIKIKE